MTYPAIIFLALLVWSFAWPRDKVLYLVLGSAAFGALAVIPPDWVMGFNLLPASLALMVFLARYAMAPGAAAGLMRSALDVRSMGLLTAFTVVAVISAFFFPRLFAGDVTVLPMRGLGPAPLQPTNANFTQLAYILLSYLGCVVFSLAAKSESFLRVYLNALLIGTVLLILTGLIDLIIGSSGARALLAPFRTAQYTFMDGSQVLGFRRISGFLTEASAYGGNCVGYAASLLLLAAAFPTPGRRRLAHFIALTAIVMGLLSTSSTAYAGIAVLVAFYVARLTWRAATGHLFHDRFLFWELLIVYLFTMGATLLAMAAPEIFTAPREFLDEIIFNKTKTTSYLERSSWNEIAMDALYGTYGVGVGVGSARTSNWAVAILSNTGFLGGLLMAAFLVSALFRRVQSVDPTRRAIAVGLKPVVIVYIAMACLAGTTPDFGGIGQLAAIIIATSAGVMAARARQADDVHPRIPPIILARAHQTKRST